MSEATTTAPSPTATKDRRHKSELRPASAVLGDWLPTWLPPVARLADDNGWRVTVRCRECRVELNLDLPDEMQASDLWGEELGDDGAEVVKLPEPNVLARGYAALCFVCDSCADARRRAEDHSRTSTAQRTRLLASRLPASMYGVRFADYWSGKGAKRDKALPAIMEWAEGSSSKGLLLFGEVGTGKTWLAAAAVNKWLEHGPIRWCSVPVLLAQVGQAFGDEDRAKAISVLTGKGPLVLDDLDKVVPRDYALSQLFTAIDARYAAGAPLLVTTNKSPGELARRFGDEFGDPIASRLVGHCKVLEIDGPDRRLELS